MNKKDQQRNFVLDIQSHYASKAALIVPDESQLKSWVFAVFNHEKLSAAELTLRLVDEPEMQALNTRYRGKNASTNVLSFPANIPKEIDLEAPLLGDIIICVPVVNEEARQQEKSPLAHWAHMVVHGALHLLGYDHISEEDAIVMEKKEILILKILNFTNPYEEETR